MKRLAAFFLWSLVFLALLLGLDQFLVRIDAPVPVLTEVRSFYVDFRDRLLGLGRRPSAGAPSGAQKAARPAPAPSKKSPVRAPASHGSAPRYLYADDRGELHFADSLDEVPPAYRKEAQLLNR